MRLFNKDYSLEQMVKVTSENWHNKLDAPKEDYEILIKAETDQVKQLKDMASGLNDKYARWFLEEAHYGLVVNEGVILLMASVNDCLSHVAKSGVPKVFKGMDTFQIFYTLYEATLKANGAHPEIKLDT